MWTSILIVVTLIVNAGIGYGYLCYYFWKNKQVRAKDFVPTKAETCFLIYCFLPALLVFIMFELLQRLLGRKQ